MTKNEIFKRSCLSCANFTITSIAVREAVSRDLKSFQEYYKDALQVFPYYDNIDKNLITIIQSLNPAETDPYHALIATCVYAAVPGIRRLDFGGKLAESLLLLAKRGYEVTYNGPEDYAYENLVKQLSSIQIMNLHAVYGLVEKLFKIQRHEGFEDSPIKDVEDQYLEETEPENLDDGANRNAPEINRKAFNASIAGNPWSKVSIANVEELVKGTVFELDALNDMLNNSCGSKISITQYLCVKFPANARSNTSLIAMLAKVLSLGVASDSSHMQNAFLALARYAASLDLTIVPKAAAGSVWEIYSTLEKQHASDWDEYLTAVQNVFEFADITTLYSGKFDTEIKQLAEVLQKIWDYGDMQDVALKIVEAIKIAPTAGLADDTANTLRIALQGKE